MLIKSRIWKFRLGAVLLGLLPWFIAELALRVFAIPTPSAADPYVNLQNLQPLFQPSTDPGILEIGAERLNLFCPARFSKSKPNGTYRVFALGGSTTYGEPYRSETAFPKWLELNLQAAAPEQTVEVINCGGLSYASYRVLAILREVLQYNPDLIIVYTGHNEYLEQRSYASALNQDSLLGRLVATPSRLRTVQLLQTAIGRLTGPPLDRDAEKSRTVMLTEVDALLDYNGGLENYHRNASWREPVVEHFRWNLRQMAVACKASKVPLVLVKPVANLLDCPPLKIEADLRLSESQRNQFETLWEQSRATEERQTAVDLLIQALRIDPQHAGANYLLGKLYSEQRKYDSAQTYLTLAKDWDVCPLRATTSLQQAVESTGTELSLPMVDAQKLFSELSKHKLVGDRWLVDHIHPTVEGHQKLGEALAEVVLAEGLRVSSNDDWRSARRELYETHMGSLGEAYYHRGKQRLEGLLLWTQGRAKKVRTVPASTSESQSKSLRSTSAE
jgi:lysophospholipase L1-like esterase